MGWEVRGQPTASESPGTRPETDKNLIAWTRIMAKQQNCTAQDQDSGLLSSIVYTSQEGQVSSGLFKNKTKGVVCVYPPRQEPTISSSSPALPCRGPSWA